jgi:PAS domain S-box-containing protein
MNLKLKIWLILGLVMLTLSALALVINYRAIEAEARALMHQQAMDLRATLMATRRVYHKQFLASGLALDEKTLGFLPAHAMTRIAEEFPNWTRSGVRFNNVSDQPRNPANQADADELAAMAWFRANPAAEEYTGTIHTDAGKDYFHFAAPIWTEAYCLTCHAAPESAPPTIRQRYDAGYGYQVGELRGVMSIRIPADSGREIVMTQWWREVAGLAVLLLALYVSLGLALNHFLVRRVLLLDAAARRMAAGDDGVRLADMGHDELGVLGREFNQMAEAIEQRERALRASQLNYRILAEYSWSWDYWLGADGVYRYVSPACATITGHAPAEFIADAGLMERLLHPDDLPEWRAHLAEDERGGPDHPHPTLILRIRNRDGGIRWIEHACLPVYDADGVYLGRRGINLDIDARKRADELEHFSAFQAGIAEMSTSVLHNIGNAITAVTQDAETIDHAGGELLRVVALLRANAARSRLALEAEVAASAELVGQQCAIQLEAANAIERLSEQTLRKRARSLGNNVRHIADIVRIQQSAALPNAQYSSFSLRQAFSSVLEMQGESLSKRGIEVVVEVDPRVDLLTLPHNRLLQSLINALRNSVESIEARAQRETFAGRIRLSAEPAGEGQVRITLEDNGAGIDPSLRDKLFHFGYSTKQRGSGFGLHSMAVFAQEAGGRVTLDSDGPDQGARLVLELPLRLAAVGRDGKTN